MRAAAAARVSPPLDAGARADAGVGCVCVWLSQLSRVREFQASAVHHQAKREQVCARGSKAADSLWRVVFLTKGLILQVSPAERPNTVEARKLEPEAVRARSLARLRQPLPWPCS